MRFVKVNYHLNKKFFVEDEAYKQMIIKTLRAFQTEFTVTKLEITGLEQNNAFRIMLTIKKPPQMQYAVVTQKIQKEIEDKSQLLINAKPTNIEINFDKE